MVKIAQHIASLLYCHDCVILPEFGGFITTYKSAKIDTVSKQAIPPSKNISFNKLLTHNDGLLINELVKKEGLTYKDAEQKVFEYISSCKTSLKEDGRFDIENIGLLYINEGTINFQSHNVNYLSSSFGFPTIQFNKIERKEEEIPVVVAPKIERKTITAPVNRVEEKVAQSNIQRKKRTIPKYMVTVIAIMLMFYTAWIPMKTDVLQSGVIELSDLNPFTYNRCLPTYESKPFEASTLIEDIVEDTNNIVNIEGKKFIVEADFNPNSQAIESTYVEVVAKEEKWEKTYFVVAGCFKEKSNADELIKKLNSEGYEAELIDQHKGLYRVSFKKFKSRRKAKALFKEVKEKGVSAWILKK